MRKWISKLLVDLSQVGLGFTFKLAQDEAGDVCDEHDLVNLSAFY